MYSENRYETLEALAGMLVKALGVDN